MALLEEHLYCDGRSVPPALVKDCSAAGILRSVDRPEQMHFWVVRTPLPMPSPYNVKKSLAIFPSPAGMSLTKLSLAAKI
jgi:hypothetical protein